MTLLDPHLNLNGLSYELHKSSKEAGWWDTPANVQCDDWLNLVTPQKLVLIHSEISEAVEGHRKGLMDEHLPHRSMFEVEIADALIRIFDLAGAHNLDLTGAVIEKAEYNNHRSDHKKENREAPGGKTY